MAGSSDVLAKVQNIAKMAGLVGQRKGDLLIYPFDLGNDRKQLVFIDQFDETSDGNHIIRFLSPCEKLGAGMFGGIGKAKAVKLLRLNAAMRAAHFCLMNLGDGEYVCARATQILETMEVEEFKEHCLAVCLFADKWEETIGRDDF